MPLHPLVKLALEAKDLEGFNAAATEFEECLYVEKSLSSTPYVLSHLTSQDFAKALGNPDFDWNEYYSLRKPSPEEISKAGDAITWTAYQHIKDRDDPNLCKTAYRYFCINHAHRIINTGRDNLLHVFQFVTTLPSMERDALPVWSKLEPSQLYVLSESLCTKNLPESSALKTNPMYQEVAAFASTGRLPTLFHPLDIPSLFKQKPELHTAAIHHFIESDIPFESEQLDTVYNALVPYIIDSILTNKVSKKRLEEFKGFSYENNLSAPLLEKLEQIAESKKQVHALQTGFLDILMMFIGATRFDTRYKLSKKLDVNLLNQAREQIATTATETASNSLREKLVEFFLQYFPNELVTSEIVDGLKPQHYPLYYIHLPAFKGKPLAEAVSEQLHALSSSCLSQVHSKSPFLLKQVWHSLAFRNKKTFLELCIKAEIRIPLKWLRQLKSPELFLSVFSTYKTFYKHPKCVRALAYSYAAQQVDLSEVFPDNSVEKAIIKRLLMSSALKSTA